MSWQYHNNITKNMSRRGKMLVIKLSMSYIYQLESKGYELKLTNQLIKI